MYEHCQAGVQRCEWHCASFCAPDFYETDLGLKTFTTLKQSALERDRKGKEGKENGHLLAFRVRESQVPDRAASQLNALLLRI